MIILCPVPQKKPHGAVLPAKTGGSGVPPVVPPHQKRECGKYFAHIG